MTIQIIRTESEHYANIGATYFTTELQTEKHHITVIKKVPDTHTGRPTTYHVINNGNAAARVWRSLGRSFNSVAEATAHYKTPAVKAMIEHAAGL